MNEKKFMEKLEAAGYDCWIDGVVMVALDPRTQSEEQLKRLVKDVIGWPRSWGLVCIPPRETGKAAAEKPAASLPEGKKSRKPKSAAAGKAETRAGSGRPRSRTATEPPDIPGQMNIFDFLAR